MSQNKTSTAEQKPCPPLPPGLLDEFFVEFRSKDTPKKKPDLAILETMLSSFIALTPELAQYTPIQRQPQGDEEKADQLSTTDEIASLQKYIFQNITSTAQFSTLPQLYDLVLGFRLPNLVDLRVALEQSVDKYTDSPDDFGQALNALPNLTTLSLTVLVPKKRGPYIEAARFSSPLDTIGKLFCLPKLTHFFITPPLLTKSVLRLFYSFATFPALIVMSDDVEYFDKHGRPNNVSYLDRVEDSLPQKP